MVCSLKALRAANAVRSAFSAAVRATACCLADRKCAAANVAACRTRPASIADAVIGAAAFNLSQFGKPRDIDDQIRLDQAQIEHRTKRLAPGDDLGDALRVGDQGERRA